MASEAEKKDVVSRRTFVRTASGLGVAAIVGWGVSGYLATQQPAARPAQTVTVTKTETVTTAATTPTTPVTQVQLEWAIWPWGVELVQDNARIFNENNPDIKVSVTDGGAAYPQYIYTRFAGADPPTIMYTTPDMQQVLMEKKWSVDMEDYAPDIKRYWDELYPGVREFFTNPFTGKMYGLNYWLGPISLGYNERHLKEVGYKVPLKSYDELAAAALAIKKKGLAEFPIGANWSWGFGYMLYNIMVGNEDPTKRKLYLFDENLNPVFADKSSPFFEAIRWFLDRVFVDKTISPGIREFDEPGITQALAKGTVSLALGFPDYDIAGANAEGAPEKGNVRFGLNPGTGYSTFHPANYMISKATMDKGKAHQEAAWRLLQFCGGKTTNAKPDFANGEYFVCNRLIRLFGVTSAYRKVMEDPQNKDALRKLGIVPEDFLAQYEKLTPVIYRDPRLTLWWGDWFMSAGAVVGGSLREKFEQFLTGKRGHGDQDILNFLNEITDDWNRLKKQAGQ